MSTRSLTSEIEWPAARRRLSAWYRRNSRDLPWRQRQHDPYAQLVAELMLHQTQVATVIPYYMRFIERYPTVQALARADRSQVVALWSGLGYYRRCHLLHEAAIAIVNKLGGHFPHTVEGLMELPGIGRYTAGAIASIAFDERAPVLDGNVRRVLLRLLAIQDDPDSRRVADRLWEVADEALPRRNCGQFNQALMELGATICTPRQPACGACPLRKECQAHRQALVEVIPQAKRKRRPSRMTITALVVTTRDKVLVRRRDAGALWPGAWEIPSAEANGSPSSKQFADLAPASVLRQLDDVHDVGVVTHQLTHRTVEFRIYAATARAVRLPAGFAWLSLHGELPLPTAFRKVLSAALTAANDPPEPAGRWES